MKKLRPHISARALKAILFFAIVLGLALLLKEVDFARTLPVVANIDVALVIAVFFLGGVNIFLVTLRWHVLLKAVKSDISFKNAVTANIGAMAINTAGPGKLGIPAKAILLKKLEGVEINQSLPSVFMDLLLEILALAMLLVISALAIGMHNTVLKFAASVFASKNIFYVAGILFVVLLIGYRLRRKIAANDFAQKAMSALQKTLKRKDIFALALALSLLNSATHFWADQLLFKALQQNIPYGFVMFSSAFSAMAGWLSPLPSGLGVWELSRAYLFKAYYGIGELAVIMTLLRRLLTYGVMALIYAVNAFFLTRNKSLAATGISGTQALQNSLVGD
jgi:uncharacterized protein (TIRG00374 family)